MWTLARVAEVIEKTTGVKNHAGHVWRMLRQMGWSRPPHAYGLNPIEQV
ncbi:MAG: helix-turn-helix domain-containing protein [Acidimicrobiales bacterium]